MFFFYLVWYSPLNGSFPICHGAWHCGDMVILSTDFHRFMECVGFSALWYLSHCGGLILLLSGFPSTDIILPLWGKTKWVVCEFFHQYHAPLCHGIVGTRKPSPRTFIGQWAGEAYPTLHHVGYGGMSVCRHCGFICLHYYYTRWWGKIQWKKYVLIFFNIFF